MSLSFTFPTFDEWCSCTLQAATSQAGHTYVNCYQTWWKLDGTLDPSTTVADFLVFGIASKMADLFNGICGGVHGISCNVVAKTAGRYYGGWVSNPHTVVPQTGQFLGWEDCYCIRQYTDTPLPRYVGRFQVPFVAKTMLASDGTWSLLAKASQALWASDYLSGYSLFGQTYRPMKPANNRTTWEYVTALGWGSRPGHLYRRRPRAWKVAPAIQHRYPFVWNSPTFSWP